MSDSSGFTLPSLPGATPWRRIDRMPIASNEEFRFAMISDRTGLPKPGVFERAIQVTNLLRPQFAIHVGDCIEGYTRRTEVLAAEWNEFDRIIDDLEVPLFQIPGNHDISNPAMRDEWQRRFGTLHYAFRYQDVLFLALDTQDPPQRMADFGGLDEVAGASREDPDLDMDKLRRSYDADPRAFAESVERSMDCEGAQPAHISDEQIEWAVHTIKGNADVRWTFLLMHIPFWQGDGHPALSAIRAALKGRPYTAFGGHLHNYQRRVIEGMDHIRLGPSGGAWTSTRVEGNFDHVTLVTMTSAGPHIVNFVLDGVLGVEGGAFCPAPMFP